MTTIDNIEHGIWPHICREISARDNDFSPHTLHRCHGGDINRAFRLQGRARSKDGKCKAPIAYFIKINTAHLHEIFVQEAIALKVIDESKTIRCPQVVLQGNFQEHSYLVLEYLPLSGTPNYGRLAKDLVAMHSTTGTCFGWQNPENIHHNFIGTTPQKNTPSQDWAKFFIEQRLLPQIALAQRHNYSEALKSLETKFLKAAAAALEAHQPRMSLVHGDLWSGNVDFMEDSTPCLYDPACYYGDREVDLAMLNLFGGMPREFFVAYKQLWPFEPGEKRRATIYNCYHILNHYNLFGGSYLGSALTTMKKIVEN